MHCSTLHYLVSFLYIRKPTLDYNNNNNKCYCILKRAGPKSRTTCFICVSLLSPGPPVSSVFHCSLETWSCKDRYFEIIKRVAPGHCVIQEFIIPWHVFITVGTWYVANPLQGPITRPQGYWLLYRGRVYRSFSCQRKLKCYILSYFCRYQN